MADFNPRNIKAWKQEVKAAKSDLADIADLSAQLEKSTLNLSESQKTNNKFLGEVLDASKEAAKQGKMNLEQLKERVDLIKDISKGEMDLNQIKEIKNDEKSLRKKIEKFRQDEIDHKDIAYDEGATKEGLYSIFDKVIKTGSKIAINISEKI